MVIILKALLGTVICFSMGCAYRLGSPERTLPGGHRAVKIPIFKNLTQEPGIEVDFTNSIINEFLRSKIVKVTDSDDAKIFIEGIINSVSYTSGDIDKHSTNDLHDLPSGSVLSTSYNVTVVATLNIKRRSDLSVLWSGQFTGQRSYVAPKITAAVLNTANPLYNQSAHRNTIQEIANVIMAEAHDSMTENF
jgi:hypothetical protein